MQRLDVRLGLAFHLNEPHRRTCRRFRNRLRIQIIVLLRLYMGPYIFGRHKANLVPLGGEQAAQMMRTAARLHRNNAVPNTLSETLKRTPSHPPPQNYPAGCVHTRQTSGVLAKINSNDDDVHRPVPSLKTNHDPNGSQREGRAFP